MIPSIAATRLTGSARRAELPLLVLGSSLGTSAAALWGPCAPGLTDDFDVLAWDLPGHGHNRGVPEEDFTLAELAAGVLVVLDEVVAERGGDTSFAYAGDSLGGAVGLQLAVDAPDRLTGAVLLCTGARIGTPESWADRVAKVDASGTAGLVAASAERWFAPGFLERDPARGSALLHSLQAVEDRGYAQACRALAAYDLRDRLGEISTPVLAVAGAHDLVCPPSLLRALADGVPDGRYAELDAAGHLAPAECPAEVAALIRHHLLGEEETMEDPTEAGMAVRREVLGEDHVDRAVAATSELTHDFQQLITRYAWGSVWTRPGLDRRSRSMITLTALVAGGHDEELGLHLRAARRNGLSWEEIGEVLLQSAIYCGVPAANTAFRIAEQVRQEEES